MLMARIKPPCGMAGYSIAACPTSIAGLGFRAENLGRPILDQSAPGSNNWLAAGRTGAGYPPHATMEIEALSKPPSRFH